MFEKSKSLLLATVIITAGLLALQTGCARTGTGNIVPAGGGEPKVPADRSGGGGETVLAEEEVNPATKVYDLEAESLVEDEIVDTTEKMEGLAATKSDSFVVDDIVEVPDTSAGFDTGYRVQLFATSDLERARELKKNVMAETGLEVYIEYEGGLYKVRVGDFPGREDAAAARTVLVERYPDCWIVKTTIRK